MWFWLNQDRALEANLVLVFNDQRQHALGLFKLLADPGVEQGFIAFAAAPHDIVFTIQSLGHIHGVFDLGGGIGKNIGVRIGCSARHEAAIGKHVGGAPQQFLF